MTLSSIIEDVNGRRQTLTVYDATDPEAVDDLKRHFEVQTLTVEEATVPDGPDDFAVLHDDGEFLAASDLERLREVVTFDAGLLDATDFQVTDYPDVLERVDDTTFTAYGKRRMILASRDVEQRAWRAEGGELHAGFQRLSLLGEQWDLYRRIRDAGVEVHVYGAPDWDPPETDGVTVHASDDDEILESWFVAFESPDGSDCALLAEEREPNAYSGFWTYDEAIAGDVLGHLRAEYE